MNANKSTSLTIDAIAKIIEPAEVEGDSKRAIVAAAPLKEAKSDQISIFTNVKYKEFLPDCQAGCLLVPQKLKQEAAAFKNSKIYVPDTTIAWRKVLAVWQTDRHPKAWVSPDAFISPSAKIAPSAYVGPYCVVSDNATIGEGTCLQAGCFIGEGAAVGADCLLYARVTVYHGCRLGDRVILHSGCVIGADGFGFVTIAGRQEKIPQIGTVEIGDSVEIGANSTIDRATMGATRIGEGTKIDNLVQIAHNVQIGKHCFISAQTGIAGSSTVGDCCILAGQVGVGDHIDIVGGTIVAGQGGVIGDVKSKDVLWGTPARNIKEAMRLQAYVNRLPEFAQTLKKISKKLGVTDD
ncbi:MAG: UDP-3-O-(3-hydroxymyristoyl)glucosamine N-acyltransferase [Elusimicrobiota bacterium]